MAKTDMWFFYQHPTLGCTPSVPTRPGNTPHCTSAPFLHNRAAEGRTNAPLHTSLKATAVLRQNFTPSTLHISARPFKSLPEFSILLEKTARNHCGPRASAFCVSSYLLCKQRLLESLSTPFRKAFSGPKLNDKKLFIEKQFWENLLWFW